MAQQVEVAQLYYTLGARADASTQAVVSDQTNALDQLESVAKEAGVPIGALRAAVAELTDAVESELRAAVTNLGKDLDATGVSAAELARQTEAIGEASAESAAALSAQVRLYAQGTQIAGTREQALARLASIEQQIKGRLDAGNLSIEQRIRLESVLAQAQVATVGALGRASSAIAGAQRSTKTAGEAVKDFGSKWSNTALQIVTAGSSIVQSGNVSSGGLKSVLLGATSLAGFLGAGGALVVAAAVAANAIIGVFTKAREEAKKAADDTIAEIQRLQNAGDIAGLNTKAQTLFEGTAAAGYKDGIRALRAELAALDQQLAGAGVLGQLDAKTKDERKRVAATLKGLEEDFARTLDAIQNPARATPGGRLQIKVTTTSPGSDAEGARRAAEATTATAAAFRDVRQAVEDLVGSVRGGESVLAAFDRRVREIGDAFAKLKSPTAEQREEFTRLQAAVAGARASLVAISGQQAADELRKIESALTPTVLDDMAVGMKQLADELKRLNAPPEVVARVLGLKQALDDATLSGNALDERLTAIATSGAGPLRQMIALGEVRREKEAELLGITAKGEEGDRRRAVLKAQIAKIQAEETRLANDQATAEAVIVDHAESLLVVMEDIASAAFGVATAFLGADATLTKMIGGAAQVASGLSRIAELADKANGYKKLFSTSEGFASALPAIGGLLGGVAAIASQLGESPAQKEQRELLRRNNERLEQLRQTLGDALKQTSSGAKIGAVGRALNAVSLPDNNNINFQRIAAISLRMELQKLGLTMADLRQIAKDAGLELSENPTIEQLKQIRQYLNELDFSAFADSFSGAMERLSAEFELFPDRFKTSADRFKAILAELANPESGAPDLFKGLQGIDTSTSEGQAAALAEIQRLFELLKDNKLTAADLNGLSLEEFFATLKRLKQELGDLPQDKSAAERFSDALEAFGVAVELGSLSVDEKLQKVKDLFSTLFPELAASVDTSSAEAFKASIQTIIDGFAADGELSDAEQAQIAVLRQLIAAFTDSSDAAADLAEKARQAMEDARNLIFTIADALIAVRDIGDPVEILRIKAAALVQAFPELADVIGQLDLTTQAGRDALEAWIQSLIDSPEALAAMAKTLGISIDQLIGWLLGLESAADAAATKVATLADRIASAFDEVAFGLNLEGITDPFERLTRTVQGIAGVIPEIDAALAGLDLSTESGRATAEQQLIALGKTTTDPAVRDAILSILSLIRGVPPVAAEDAAAGTDAAQPAPSTSAQSGVQQITERTGLQINELQRVANRLLERQLEALMQIVAGFDARGLFAAFDPSQLLQPPRLATAASTTTNTGTIYQIRVQNTFTGPITADDPAILSAATEQSVREGMQKALGSDLSDIRAFRGGWPS